MMHIAKMHHKYNMNILQECLMRIDIFYKFTYTFKFVNSPRFSGVTEICSAWGSPSEQIQLSLPVPIRTWELGDRCQLCGGELIEHAIAQVKGPYNAIPLGLCRQVQHSFHQRSP